MPRGRRSSPSPMRRPAPERSYRPPPPTRQPAPAPPTQMAAPASQGPGMMGQIAGTAAGVAIGSVVGHGVSSALFGGHGSSESKPDVTYQEQQPQQFQQQPQVCSWELQQFLACAQNQGDISLCEGFNDALKQCKRNYGVA
uniref:coiled-coil-helix-coiled-coil-helix domain-containing protein 2 n=1 Tax=Ciona intestinalis TaxID=7719 RepID=UPI000180BBCF|nr:coiled-coil-helix-coiled-coil-helix domain-containing protein 2 [Ciona intestinalis]|eukprot:XP_002124542.1 coiled-coil-helix-coiled-coil-helix domain-containing protein 2 [Ciona intestinalis]